MDSGARAAQLLTYLPIKASFMSCLQSASCAAEVRAAHAFFDETQRAPCRRVGFYSMTAFGAGHDINAAVRALHWAVAPGREGGGWQLVFLPPSRKMREQRKMVCDAERPWHWMPSTPMGQFWRLSQCQRQLLNENRSWFQRVSELYTDHGHFVKPHDSIQHPWHRLFDLPGVPFSKRLAIVPRSDIPVSLEELPQRFQHMGLAWWFSVLTAYLIELNGDLLATTTRHTAIQALRSDLSERAHLAHQFRSTTLSRVFGAEDRAAFNFGVAEESLFDLGLHIRVGDACSKAVHRQDVVAKRFRRCGTSLSEELSVALAAAQPRHIRSVFLSSDDPMIIQQARAAEIRFSLTIYALSLDRQKYNVTDHLEEVNSGMHAEKEQVLVDVVLEMAALSRSAIIAGFMFGSVPRVALQLRVRKPFEYVTLDGYPWCEFAICKGVTRGLSRSKVTRGCMVSTVLKGDLSCAESWIDRRARIEAEARSRATGIPHYTVQELHLCALPPEMATLTKGTSAYTAAARPLMEPVRAHEGSATAGASARGARQFTAPVSRTDRSLGVIIYLVQARKSSRRGHESMPVLQQSVRLLVKNYLRTHHDDVMFLHAGDVDHSDQRQVLELCEPYSRARFVTLPGCTFSLPRGTPTQHWVQPNKFSAGYRHMIRLFTIGIWKVIADEGYEYVMRLDDDSSLLSPIEYNIFDRMQAEGIDYAYRLAVYESGANPGHWHRFMRSFLVERRLKPKWLLDPCGTKDVRNYTFKTCGHLYGFYNNFFVTRVGFWLQQNVQIFLEHIDKSHTIYTQRWGDLLWHSAAVQIYMDPARVRMLRDFAYEHSTFHSIETRKDSRPSMNFTASRCLMFGGVVLGDSGNQSAARERMVQLARSAFCRKGDFKRTSIRPCLLPGSTINAGNEPVLGGLVSSPANVLSDEQPFCHLRPRPFICGAQGAYVNTVALLEPRLAPQCLCNVSTARSSKFALCVCINLWQAGIL